MQIGSKRKFYELWHAGVLGNRPQTYFDVEVALRDGATRLGFRQIGIAGGGAFAILDKKELGSLFKPQVRALAIEWERCGRKYCLDSAVPNSRVTLLGELVRTTRGLEGFLGVRTGLTMRESIAKGLVRPTSPITTMALLDQFMDPSSRDDVNGLLELFPDHVIEFACFPENVGVLPHRNTIIWEVRAY